MSSLQPVGSALRRFVRLDGQVVREHDWRFSSDPALDIAPRTPRTLVATLRAA